MVKLRVGQANHSPAIRLISGKLSFLESLSTKIDMLGYPTKLQTYTKYGQLCISCVQTTEDISPVYLTFERIKAALHQS